jgi:hypothetical protein
VTVLAFVWWEWLMLISTCGFWILVLLGAVRFAREFRRGWREGGGRVKET